MLHDNKETMTANKAMADVCLWCVVSCGVWCDVVIDLIQMISKKMPLLDLSLINSYQVMSKVLFKNSRATGLLAWPRIQPAS